MSTYQFRLLIAATTIIGIFGGVFDIVFPTIIPKTLSEAQAANDAFASTSLFIIWAIIMLANSIVGLAATIGLFMFRPWAPRLAVATSILVLPILILSGVSVSSGWAVALNQLSVTLWGVVLAIVYFSPLKEKFVVTR